MKRSAAIALIVLAGMANASAEPKGGKLRADGSTIYEIEFGSVTANPDGTVRLMLPNSRYMASMKLQGFRISEVNSKPEGVMFMTDADARGFIASGYFEKAKAKSAIACREFYFTHALKSPLPKKDVARTEKGKLAIGEYLITGVMGKTVEQHNRNIYAYADSYCLDLHISKVLFDAAVDAPFIDAWASSVSMMEK
jgi:hypothetical protein